MKRKLFVRMGAACMLAVFFCVAALRIQAADPAGKDDAVHMFGKDSVTTGTDRIGVAEGGIVPRSAVGSMCTISYGASHSYGSWFTREFYVAAETGNYTGYCVQPLSPPPSGSYQVSKLDNDLIKALLMMAPGYPYFDSYGRIIYDEARNNTYAYAHAALSYAYEGSLTGLSESMQAGIKNMIMFANAAVEGSWAPEVHANLDRYEVYIAYNDQQDIVWLEEQQEGDVWLQKVSAQTEVTDGNNCYSLEGAVYGVYTDPECGDQIGELVTGEDGSTGTLSVKAGTYYVKEKTASRGYALDGTVYTVNALSGQTAQVTAREVPQTDRTGVLLKKYDGELEAGENGNRPQGAASLAGAEFTFRFYAGDYDSLDKLEGVRPARSWVFRSDEKGIVSTEDAYFVSGDPVWRNQEGAFVLPLGTLTIEETKAPEGYNLSGEVQLCRITGEGEAEYVETYAAPDFPEDIIRGDLEIIKVYQNEDEKEDVLDGICGVEFTITSRTTGEEVLKIVTDREGKATTKSKEQPRGALVYDTYIVSETKTPEGYNPIEPFEVTIAEEQVTLGGIYRQDTLLTSPIQVLKVDASTGKVIPVAGARFQLLDADKQVVTMTAHYPENQEYETFTTNKEGRFTFPEKLQYGTYYLREVKAPEGYLLNGEDLPFTVEEDRDWSSPLVVRFADENAMGRFSLAKYEEGGEELLAGAVFEIRAAEDITTPDGTVRLRKGELADTLTTGQEPVLSKELFLGTYAVTEVKQVPGFALAEEPVEVELAYRDQETPLVTQDLTVYNEPTRLRILKYEKGTQDEKPLAGVTFRVWLKQDEKDPDPAYTMEEVYETDEDGCIEIPYLLPGSTYCVQEEDTLQGYIRDETVHEIQVDEKGHIDGEAVAVLKCVNDYTKLRIVKLDAGDHSLLAGAKLRLERKTEDGGTELIERWISDEKEKRFDRLAPGEYILTEEAPPDGYETAQPVSFTLRETGEEQKIEMEDKPEVRIPKTGDLSAPSVPALTAVLSAAVVCLAAAGRIRKKRK